MLLILKNRNFCPSAEIFHIMRNLARCGKTGRSIFLLFVVCVAANAAAFCSCSPLLLSAVSAGGRGGNPGRFGRQMLTPEKSSGRHTER